MKRNLRIAILIAVLAVVAIAIKSNFDTLDAQLDRTADADRKGYGDMDKSKMDAEIKAAEAKADLESWQRRVTNSATNQ